MPALEIATQPASIATDKGIGRLLAANAEWRVSKAAQDPTFFRQLGSVHEPEFMWIGCSDARVPPDMITKEEPGSMFVVRNVANLVNPNDNNLMSALTYAVNVLKVPNIIVCGHYECGGVMASSTNRDHSAPLENWIQNIRDVYRLHRVELDRIKDPVKRHRRLVELNVKEQCINLYKSAVIQKSRVDSFNSGEPVSLPRIHACVFDPNNGELKRLDVDFQKEIEDLEDIYKLYSIDYDKKPTVVDKIKTEIKEVAQKIEQSALPQASAAKSIIMGELDQAIQKYYPGALTTEEFASILKATLASRGYDFKKILLATSFCCDELNRDTERDLMKIFGQNFSMGGLAGTPFGGATAFGAMVAHIPTGGDCCVIYGPHVGIDLNGKIGNVERRGRKGSGASCGSAQAAYAYVNNVRKGKIPITPIPDYDSTDFVDAQQIFVNNSLLPSAERLAKSAEPMAELPRALFDIQDKKMSQIIVNGAAGVGKHSPDGTVIKVGGIQINTPPGFPEYFYPIKIEIFNQQGRMIEAFSMETEYKYIPDTIE